MNIFSSAYGAVIGILSEPITVQRRPETRDDSGVVRIGPITTYQARAVVVDQPPNDLVRESDYQIALNSILVTTSFPLQGPTPGYQPDHVIWHGTTYIVTNVLDYSQNGRGFVTALCQSIEKVDGPPMQP
jgi:hypothetical protein